MWTYKQSTGELSHDGALVGKGYSGANPDGKNNPAMESIANVGPIPQGRWQVVGKPFDTTTHGPFCLRLWPAVSTMTYGREGFLIHGDSLEMPGMASQGCIILARPLRNMVVVSGDRDLEVVA